MFGSYGLARIAMQMRQQDWRSAFFDNELDKIMLPQKKEIAKLFICTLTFPKEIKYDCGTPATSGHDTSNPSHETGFYLCAPQMADNGVLPYRR
ncbi:hypothetical protein SAMN05216517_11078 [Janthinobacterium sp. OK676]|uniref:hypothetical protein n=2 Tax=unclassified Janthinobacterium TaxID=2610881 RepID=UPI0008880A95|nr:hypothetical protein [Janthinobacterium sp. 67]PJJ21472.1 hypothetical protein CLU90_4760 [Janthinobacterium sp. 67]SDN38091.1 hypothetical protein SAMN05216517_11078 [Janthinobacterium sp. OK676]